MITDEALLRELADKDDWIGASKLAKTFGVTTRTLRSYVRRINGSSKSKVIDSSHSGYRLVCPPNSLLFSKQTTPTSSVPEGQDARVSHLFAQLLTLEQGAGIYELADSLCVADSTIMSDLQHAREMARAFNLTLTRQRDIVRLEGIERSKRRLISHLMTEQGDLGFVSLTSQLLQKKSYSTLQLNALIAKALEDEGLYASDYGLRNIALHLSIMLDRISQGRTVSELADTQGLEESAAWRAAHSITITAIGQCDMPIPKNELHYLALIVSANSHEGYGTRSSIDTVKAYLNEADLHATRQAVHALEQAYGLEQFGDDFIARLAIHVHSLVLRAKGGSYLPNPLAEKTKASYPLIYDMSVFLANKLSDFFDIKVNEDEIAFLAFHIGGHFENVFIDQNVVTVSVLHMGYNDLHVTLIERLQKMFGDAIIIARVDSVARVDSALLRSDIVVTPLPLQVPLAERVVVVSPLVSDDDLDAIRRAVDSVRSKKQALRAVSALRQFIRPELFRRNCYAKTHYELIELLCDDCKEKGLCDSDFREAVLERERLSSTAFGGMCAAPHSVRSFARESFLYLVVNDRPLKWGNQKANIILLIGTSGDDRDSFKVAYEELLVVLAESYAANLAKCTTYDAFVDQLENAIMIEHGFAP